MELVADMPSLGVSDADLDRWAAAGVREAVVEPVDGEYFASVSSAPGAWAYEPTPGEALSVLQEVLVGWATLKLEFGHDDLPAFGGIGLS